MAKFANYKDGVVTIGSSRLSDAMVTDVQDIVNSHRRKTSETLTASINNDIELAGIEEIAS